MILHEAYASRSHAKVGLSADICLPIATELLDVSKGEGAALAAIVRAALFWCAPRLFSNYH